MTAAKIYSDFKIALAKCLAPSEFRASGDLLCRRVRDVLVVLEIQRDRKHSTKSEIRFTINVGLFAMALGIADEETSSASIPSTERCHWRARLGRLTSAQSDLWWVVGEGHEAQRVSEEIATEIVGSALPKIEPLTSSEALIKEWLDGRGQGLTEYERRLNLARLLIASGRKEEARTAIQVLEEASTGKSWEVSARYEAKVLIARLENAA